MTDRLCSGWHRRGRAHPRAKYLVRHRDDPPEQAKPMCGTHARSYRNSAIRWGSGSAWIVEEIA